jgi:hypothetical protein
MLEFSHLTFAPGRPRRVSFVICVGFYRNKVSVALTPGNFPFRSGSAATLRFSLFTEFDEQVENTQLWEKVWDWNK